MGHSIRGIKHWLKTHLTPSGGKASNLVQPRSAPNGLHARDASKQTLAPRQPVPFSQRKPVPTMLPEAGSQSSLVLDKPLPPTPPPVPAKPLPINIDKPLPLPPESLPPEPRGMAMVRQLIQQRDPAGAHCLGKIIANARSMMAVMEPASRARCEASLARTFEVMDRAALNHRGAGLPPAIQKVIALAVANVGVYDLAIVGDLVPYLKR